MLGADRPRSRGCRGISGRRACRLASDGRRLRRCGRPCGGSVRGQTLRVYGVVFHVFGLRRRERYRQACGEAGGGADAATLMRMRKMRMRKMMSSRKMMEMSGKVPTGDFPHPSRPSTAACENWWSRGGSNSRPQRCERCALPAELRPHRAGPFQGRAGRIMVSGPLSVKQSERVSK